MRPMARAAALLALPAACSFACWMEPIAPQQTDAPPAAPAAGTTRTAPLPDARPIREPYTVLRSVSETRTDPSGKPFEATLGYTVTYEAIPPYDRHLERRWPAGTVIVEDATNRMIGIITPHGTGYRYDAGRELELGRGTVEYLLPAFFGEGKRLQQRQLAG